MLLVVAGEGLIGLWTRDPRLGASAAPVLALLAAGTALHGVMHLPYALQLAYGKARLALRIAVFLVALMVPLMIVLASRHGAVGGGIAWVTAHLAYVAIGTPLTHAKLLRGTGLQWLAREVGIPLGISVAVGLAGRLALRATGWGPLANAGLALALAVLASGLSFVASPRLSAAVLENLGWRKPPPRDGAVSRIGGT
jgi:O-antigen/teichoic acid export membrane protein